MENLNSIQSVCFKDAVAVFVTIRSRTVAYTCLYNVSSLYIKDFYHVLAGSSS